MKQEKLAVYLEKYHDTLLEEWFELLIKSYPEESVKYFEKHKNAFTNPVGSNIYMAMDHILRELAGADEIPVLAVPVFQPVVIKKLNARVDDERHDARAKALLEHNEPPDAAVSVLERVYHLKTLMQVDHILKCFYLLCIVFFQQDFHFLCTSAGVV